MTATRAGDDWHASGHCFDDSETEGLRWSGSEDDARSRELVGNAGCPPAEFDTGQSFGRCPGLESCPLRPVPDDAQRPAFLDEP